jgi:MFS family permease
VIGLTTVWAMLFAAATPIRQAYMNDMIPSRQRASILSFDSLMRSGGGVWGQPVLGRAADAWGYAPSYLVAAGITTLGLPFLALSRRRASEPDPAAGAARHSQPVTIATRERRPPSPVAGTP